MRGRLLVIRLQRLQLVIANSVEFQNPITFRIQHIYQQTSTPGQINLLTNPQLQALNPASDPLHPLSRIFPTSFSYYLFYLLCFLWARWLGGRTFGFFGDIKSPLGLRNGFCSVSVFVLLLPKGWNGLRRRNRQQLWAERVGLRNVLCSCVILNKEYVCYGTRFLSLGLLLRVVYSTGCRLFPSLRFPRLRISCRTPEERKKARTLVVVGDFLWSRTRWARSQLTGDISHLGWKQG
ncbi:hypothetical protein B0H66DRAFT_194178 [Apodospora peruviana]|uniref:Uncharacterized protein n=1 Tax=Apodospora peruviana TaxID=516989 RepID=A0AAE0IBP9_9PEZI|nr:hypothetical protein B0H66DRAFT_194178 [Apodospora peruviana]